MEREPGIGPKSAHSTIVIPLRPQYAAAMGSSDDTPVWPIRCDFPARLLNRHLSELFCYHEYLRQRLILSSPDEEPDAYQDLRRLLLLIDQLLPSGRRDHARCERMLEIYRNLRNRIVNRSARINQLGCERDRSVELALSNDYEFAQRLVNVMYMTAANNPDHSAYSQAWRNTLTWHVNDLEYLVSAGRANHPLQLPYYDRDPRATGSFDFVSGRSQAETLEALRHYDFVAIKQATSTAAAFSEPLMQLATVDAQGQIRYIDVIELMENYAEFPDCKLPAYVDTHNPSSVSFTNQLRAESKFIYNWRRLRYV